MSSTPKAFIAKQFGYHHNFLGQIAAIMFSWLIFLFAISYICFR
jgi:predicted CDP-diglyceride synthetase/phosphatidate cytidylyltransferase